MEKENPEEFPRLEKSQFTKREKVLVLTLPVLKVSENVGRLKKYLWTHNKAIELCIANGAIDTTRKRLYLSEQYCDPELRFLPESVRTDLKQDESILIEVEEKQYGYEDMTTDEVLSMVIPGDVEKVMAFETIGHIAHMNLRDSTTKYKYIIGQVVLDKNKQIKTVVNKTSEISTVFRTFPMEILAGENNLIATVKECGCTYKFDFSQVYWNSRLGMEHERMVTLFKPSDVVADMFCGIGPFALPAAKKGCTVYANDLNPASYAALLENATKNKCKLHAYNMDGGEFIRMLFRGENVKVARVDHVMMNLPALAVTFLAHFIGINDGNIANPILPTVHCYGFAFGENPQVDIVEQAEKVLGKKIANFTTFNVRSVSTNKHMMRLSFPLTLELTTTNPLENDQATTASSSANNTNDIAPILNINDGIGQIPNREAVEEMNVEEQVKERKRKFENIQ